MGRALSSRYIIQTKMSLKTLIRRFPFSYSMQVVLRKHGIPSAAIQVRHMSDKIIDPPDMTPPIPEYIERSDEEPLEVRRARLVYQSRKRGMAENCLLLSTFAKKNLPTFNAEQLKLYDDIINKPSNDWELYYWMTATKPTPAEFDNSMMDMLKQHVKNENRDERLEQPAL